MVNVKSGSPSHPSGVQVVPWTQQTSASGQHSVNSAGQQIFDSGQHARPWSQYPLNKGSSQHTPRLGAQSSVDIQHVPHLGQYCCSSVQQYDRPSMHTSCRATIAVDECGWVNHRGSSADEPSFSIAIPGFFLSGVTCTNGPPSPCPPPSCACASVISADDTRNGIVIMMMIGSISLPV